MEKIKLLLYCTKQPLYLVRNECDGYFYTMDKGTLNDYKNVETYNGKIVAECEFEVDTIVMQKGADDKMYGNNGFMGYGIISKNHSFSWYDENKTCLAEEKLFKYLKGKNGYAIHIKNLHIFDKPRELFNYCGKTKQNVFYHILKAPQNMMYCYGNNTGEKYILISIRPEWLCKILNGEKTIEVRKKVLKEML